MNGDLAKKKTMDFPAPLIAPPMSGCGHSRGGVCVEGGGGGASRTEAGQKQDKVRCWIFASSNDQLFQASQVLEDGHPREGGGSKLSCTGQWATY
jgi:hypothetical protein